MPDIGATLGLVPDIIPRRRSRPPFCRVQVHRLPVLAWAAIWVFSDHACAPDGNNAVAPSSAATVADLMSRDLIMRFLGTRAAEGMSCHWEAHQGPLTIRRRIADPPRQQ